MSNGPIVTPEAVPLDLEPAGLGSRFLGLLVDWAIQGAAGFALLTGVVAASNAAGVARGLAQAGFFLLAFLVLFGYPVPPPGRWAGPVSGRGGAGIRPPRTPGRTRAGRREAGAAAPGPPGGWRR